MGIRVGINGFGRIGRNVFRACAASGSELEIVAVNDITDAGTLAHLLQYDSVHGRFPQTVEAGEEELRIDGQSMRVLSVREPANLPWKDLGVDLVLECSGLFTKRDQAAAHLKAGAKKVLISAPAEGADLTVCYGVNHEDYDPEKHEVVSNASCTTNCLAPLAKVLHEQFGIVHGLMTTVHAYTNDQKILDLPHKDLRRARAAGLSMIPTKTGAAKAIGLVIPSLAGKLDGMAVRVPVPNVSIVDLTATLEKNASADSINGALREAAEGPLRDVLAYTEEELVSTDFNGNSRSSVVDASLTRVVDDRLVKVLSWYDNEWGFSCRMRDVAELIGKSLS